MGTAARLGDDAVDDFHAHQILRRQAQRLGGVGGLVGAAPQDRGAALGRDHRIGRVLQHQHGIAGGEGDGAARAALADDGGDQRHGELQRGLDRARDGFRLAALLRLDAGIGARGVDEGQHRQAEALGEEHEPARLAIAFGPRHAEIMAHPRLGIGALLMRDRLHRETAEPPDAADDGAILGEGAVAGERHELGQQRVEIGAAVRPVGMARELHLLPRRELGEGLGQEPARLGLEPADLVGDIDVAAGGEMTQLFDLALEFRQRLLEIEEVAHRAHFLRASG